MGYAILRTVKMKSSKDIVQRYLHDYRIYHVENADPMLRSENQYDALDRLHGRSYLDICEETIRELRMEGAITKTIRHDAVKGIDIFLSFSREDQERIDLDTWVQANIAWLRKEFNPPDRQITWTDPYTGQLKTKEIDNVVSVVVHMDEQTPHIHAFVVPIDDKGHLNSKYYLSNRQSMVDRQDRYAQEMAAFGLNRGERHSIATHVQRSVFYTKMLKAVEAELPAPLPGESALDYRERANDFYQTQQSNHLAELEAKDREIVVAQSAIYEERERLGEMQQELEKKERQFEQKIDKMKDALGMDLSEGDEAFTWELRRQIRAHRRFSRALEDHPDREKAERMKKDYEEMVAWQSRREERRRRRPGLVPEVRE